MEFLVLSRQEIEKFYTAKKHIVISISDCNEACANFPKQASRIDFLFLKFADLDKSHKKFKVCSIEIAQQIWDFVQKYLDKIDLIVCQCEAGISRSAGIAAALSKALNGDDKYFFKHYLPNMLVYSLLLNAIYKEDNWLDKELHFITWLYKYKNFLGGLKRKNFKQFYSREEAMKEFYREIGEDKCPNCGGEYQQVDKYFTWDNYKVLIDACKNCGHTRER